MRKPTWNRGFSARSALPAYPPAQQTAAKATRAAHKTGLTPDRPLTLPPDGPQVEQRSYADLSANGRAEVRIRLCFLSPTSFRSHDMHFPLPDPALVYQSWLTRWNAFAPEELRINVALLDVVAAHVAVGRYSLRTEMVDLGSNRKMVGFVGSVQFNVVRAGKIGDEWLRRLNLLADYAAFCGTGHKTAHGMGQTRRERDRR